MILHRSRFKQIGHPYRKTDHSISIQQITINLLSQAYYSTCAPYLHNQPDSTMGLCALAQVAEGLSAYAKKYPINTRAKHELLF